jgi:adenine-specific DNA methylase
MINDIQYSHFMTDKNYFKNIKNKIQKLNKMYWLETEYTKLLCDGGFL